MQCPCCSNKSYEECCAPYLEKGALAQSPEALMRSRYSAYARCNFDYIVKTTDPQRLQNFDHKASRDWMEKSTFTGLQVIKSSEDGNKGQVEFIARFRRGEEAEQVHHELSRFRKQAGVWYFSQGKVVAPLIPENDTP